MAASPSQKFNNLLELKTFLEDTSNLNPLKTNGDAKASKDLVSMINKLTGQAAEYLEAFPTEEEFDQLSADNPDLFDDRNKGDIQNASYTSSSTATMNRPTNRSSSYSRR